MGQTDKTVHFATAKFLLHVSLTYGKVRVEMSDEHCLAKWIDERMPRARFAELVDTSESHLSLILNGKRGLSLDLAARIEALTEGEVRASVLLSERKRVAECAQ